MNHNKCVIITVSIVNHSKTISIVHQECDWLLQYFDARREARTSEVEAIGTAKARDIVSSIGNHSLSLSVYIYIYIHTLILLLQQLLLLLLMITTIIVIIQTYIKYSSSFSSSSSSSSSYYYYHYDRHLEGRPQRRGLLPDPDRPLPPPLKREQW